MTESLRFEFNEAEREAATDSIAVVFSIKNGNLIIREEWGYMDELYSNGCTVFVPPRIWALALPWVTERIARI